MGRRIVELHLEGSQRIPVEAWDTSVPGLIVTPGVTTHRIIENKYCITHENSGGRVGTNLWDSVEAAQLYATRLDGFADWTLDTEDLKASFPADATEQVNAIGEQLQHDLDNNPLLVLGAEVKLKEKPWHET